MILHFHAADSRPGEHDRINVGFDWENYNFNDYPESDYIEVTREGLAAIYQECDFNCYSYSDDLTAVHDETPEDDVLPFR